MIVIMNVAISTIDTTAAAAITIVITTNGNGKDTGEKKQQGRSEE